MERVRPNTGMNEEVFSHLFSGGRTGGKGFPDCLLYGVIHVLRT